MKKLLIVLIALVLTACECGADDTSTQPMSNEQIIEQTKLCNDAGLNAESLHTAISSRTVGIQCTPRNDTTEGE